jgi:hypothetical protein
MLSRGASRIVSDGSKVGIVGVRLLVAGAVVTVAVAAVVLSSTDSGAVSPGAVSVPFQAQGSLTASGNPKPTVVSFPDGASGDMHWSMCRPPDTGACEAIASIGGTANPGPEPAGTVFKLIATYQRHTYSQSLTWHGAIGVATRPSLTGRARFGATVTSSAASWRGGWGTEYDQLGIEACRTVQGTGCVMLSGNELECSPSGCGSRGGVPFIRPNRARIGNWYTGWYVFALDAHRGTDLSELVGYGSPAAIPPWPTNATVARSTAYGPVTGPPAPRVRFAPDAQAHGKHVVVASVRCAVSCHVWITVSRVGRHFASGERVAWYANTVITGSAMIGVQGSIPPGPLAVMINVGDGPYLHGRSLLR